MSASVRRLMQSISKPFGNRNPDDLLKSGRIFVVVGALFGIFGVGVLAMPVISLISITLSNTQLVQYASYMLSAQLLVNGIFSVILLLPAALLIQQGRKRIRAATQCKEATHASETAA